MAENCNTWQQASANGGRSEYKLVHMADIGKAPEGFPRRMQAARALAGLDVKALAQRLKEAGETGFSARSLRAIESGETPTKQRSRQVAIIEACGLPAAFLTADLWDLDAVEHAIDNLPAEVRADGNRQALILRAFRSLAGQLSDSEVEARLKRMENDLAALRKEVKPRAEDRPAA